MTQFSPGRFQILPTVVKNLVIINVIMVFAQFVLGNMGIDLADYLGLHYWKSEHFYFWQYFTHMFMHGSYQDLQGTIMHIFSNMFALWMFGSILENVWGAKRFLIFYLVYGLGAAMLHMGVLAYDFYQVQHAFNEYQQAPGMDALREFITQHVNLRYKLGDELRILYNSWIKNPNIDMSQDSITAINHYLNGFTNTITGQRIDGIYDEATVGASGAVFGILFAFGYLFPNTLLYIYFLVPIKAKYVVAAYAVFELFAGFRNSAGDNVAHFAHLGGMLVAFIILKIWNQRNRRDFF